MGREQVEEEEEKLMQADLQHLNLHKIKATTYISLHE